MTENFVAFPRRVQQEHAVFLDAFQQIISSDECRIVAGDEVSIYDEVFTLDELFTKTQMTAGDTTGFLGVILEISLCIHIGVIADNLDRVFIGSHSTVRAQTPEFAGDSTGGTGVDWCREIQRSMGYVIIDTHGEAMSACAIKVLINGINHGGVNSLEERP